jgi:glutamate synthase domain-containing protein 2
MHAIRPLFFLTSAVLIVAIAGASTLWIHALWAYSIVLPLVGMGLYDVFQTTHAIRRNFPLLGRLRYLFEAIRPEVQQYFVERDLDGSPLNREQRSVIYQRSKKVLDTIPFGTQADVYAVGYEWINHSMVPRPKQKTQPRITIGGPECTQPYEAAVFNISAMSFGSLSKNAQLALNQGAATGGFFHNTGEGGVSPYHLQPGGDLCWQIGTGYFGCRSDEGGFSEELFKETAAQPSVKLIEIKLSQGAKPGKGGILPAAKITAEISRIRNVPMGQDVISPSSHNTFDTPIGLLQWVARLRELSGGKPVGFKLCVGKRREFIAICKAMVQSGIKPDFVTVDGGEGGTGAAPVEFSNTVGTPLMEGLIFVHNSLVGFGVRDDIKVIASGKVLTGFDIAKRIALGADLCNAARSFMLAVGCIQALKCNNNECPTGVATQDPALMNGLVVADKFHRVANYQYETVKALMELLAASGLDHPDQLSPWHIHRRVSAYEVKHYGELFEYVEPGDLLEEPLPRSFARATRAASPDSFNHAAPD